VLSSQGQVKNVIIGAKIMKFKHFLFCVKKARIGKKEQYCNVLSPKKPYIHPGEIRTHGQIMYNFLPFEMAKDQLARKTIRGCPHFLTSVPHWWITGSNLGRASHVHASSVLNYNSIRILYTNSFLWQIINCTTRTAKISVLVSGQRTLADLVEQSNIFDWRTGRRRKTQFITNSEKGDHGHFEQGCIPFCYIHGLCYFYGHFGTFCDNWVFLWPFWDSVPSKIWRP
jgi:hypothetical protein